MTEKTPQSRYPRSEVNEHDEKEEAAAPLTVHDLSEMGIVPACLLIYLSRHGHLTTGELSQYLPKYHSREVERNLQILLRDSLIARHETTGHYSITQLGLELVTQR